MAEANNRLDELLRRAGEATGTLLGPPPGISATREPPTTATAAAGGSSHHHRRLSEREEDEEILHHEVDEADEIPRLVVQPAFIQNGVMKDYQLEGLNWLIRLYETNINGILADEMGLGKTLQSIALMAFIRQFRRINGPHCVVVPKTTLGNWQEEFRRWFPDCNVFKFHGTKEERDGLRERLVSINARPGRRGSFAASAYDVCLTTYEMARIEKTALQKIKWHLLVVDEAHRIKNEQSVLFQELNRLHTKARLLLTGTPLQNNLHELWALLYFLLPDVFTSAEDFDALFSVKSDSSEASRIIEKLHRILKPFLLRRLKAEVATVLPPKREILVQCRMPDFQREVYKNILMKDVDALQGTVKEGTRLLNMVMQLRKAANHPYLFEGVEDRTLDPYGEHIVENCGKMIILDKLVKKYLAAGSRLLIFSQMARVLDLLEDYCTMRHLQYCRIDGSTDSAERDEAIHEFNKSGSDRQVFLLTTRAGGLGINLASADIVILYDSDWNPQADLQAQDRAHRIGQKKPVFVFRLVTVNSIEEKVVERADLKLRLDALVIQQGRATSGSSNSMSKDAMVNMIRFGADHIFNATDADRLVDEDIDLVIQRGEQVTAEMREKTESAAQRINFSVSASEQEALDEAMKTEDAVSSLDFAFLAQMYENLGRRGEKRARLYSVPEAPPAEESEVKHFPEFQFFNKKRLLELEAKEKAGDSSSAGESRMTPEEEKERDVLMNEGFGEWSKSDFSKFIGCCETYGRHALDMIVKALSGKSREEVERYHKVFFARYGELEDHEKYIQRIERGEKRLAKARETQATLRRLLDQISVEDLQFRYSHMPGYAPKGRGYTVEIDRFLVETVSRVGYGDWDRVKAEIKAHPIHRFDYFLRSRNSLELARRVDLLVKILPSVFGGT